jgi:hypothetical protein
MDEELSGGWKRDRLLPSLPGLVATPHLTDQR